MAPPHSAGPVAAEADAAAPPAAGCPAMGELSAAQVSLFHKLGGHAAVKAAVDIFYDRILADAKLAPFFEGVSMQDQRRKQASFMTYVFGGPEKYTGKDLHTAHKRLIDEKGLNVEHFGMVAGHLVATLQQLGVSAELIEEVVVVVSSAKPLIFGEAAA